MSEIHYDFSPSGFKRKAICAGSHLAEKPYPDVSGEAAIDGTHTHTLVEVCLKHGKRNANEYLDASLIDHEGEFKIDKDRITRANMALTYVNNQITNSAIPVFVTPEEKVNPGLLIFRNDWAGTSDITIYGQEEGQRVAWINTVDYKDGAMPVDPFENWQGISYMLGVIAKMNPPMETPMRFTIIQPKAGGIKEWDTTVEELLVQWLPRCHDIIITCLQPDAPFVADEENACRYCKHRKACTTRQGSAIAGVNAAMAKINPVNSVVGGETALPTSLPPISEMPNETLSKVKLLAPIVRGWLKDVDEESIDRVEKGGVISLFKMINQRGRRSWGSEHDPIIKSLLLLTANGKRIFKKADVVKEQLVSFTNILGNANLSAKQKKRIEDDFIKHPQGKKTLVLTTERGEDVSPAALLEKADIPPIEMTKT